MLHAHLYTHVLQYTRWPDWCITRYPYHTLLHLYTQGHQGWAEGSQPRKAHIFNIRPDIFMLLLKFQCSSTLIHLRTPLKMLIILVKGKSRKVNGQGQGWEGIHLMRDPLCRYSYCATFHYTKMRMVIFDKDGVEDQRGRR